jgi:hypothetical protein
VVQHRFGVNVLGMAPVKIPVKANGLVDAVRRASAKGREISWAQAYESRMRRFNVEVVLAALIVLAFLIVWFFSAWDAFQKVSV